MKSKKNISEDRLKKIKEMHALVQDFIDSLADITFEKDDKMLLTPDSLETLLMLSLEACAIIVANGISQLFQSIKDKKDQQDILSEILNRLEKGVIFHISEAKKDESQSVN